jgi:D-3-phosphoglycerate dehydrogenase / 2-oxoglutarate reductase
MKIVIAENIDEAAEEIFHAADPSWEVVNLVKTKRPVAEAVVDADALLIRTVTKVTPQFLAGVKRLRVIARAGVGVDNINQDAATRKGIVVMNVPGGNTISVAEQTLTFLCMLARHIYQATTSMKQGLWEKKKFTGTELRGKTLGIIGLGRVGSAVARLAHAYEMKVIAHDPYVSARVAEERGVKLIGFEEVLRSCDYLTIHCSLTSETRGMINAHALSLTKPGVRVVNCARGEVLVGDDLLAALESGHVAGAALDVFDPEPPGASPLALHPKVILTPHIGGSTKEALQAIGTAVAEQVRDFLLTGVPRNAVNLPALPPEELRRVKPYLDLGSKLGSFLGQIAGSRIEELRVSYDGAIDQSSTYLVKNAILAGILRRSLSERVNLINAGALATERGIEVTEMRSARRAAFTNTLGIAARTDSGASSVLGMSDMQGSQRILGIDDIDVEAPLRGTILFIRNQDVPGVIGKVGTLLGDRGINIANFALGRSPEKAEAIALVNLDQPVSASDLSDLRAIGAIRFATVVEVGLSPRFHVAHRWPLRPAAPGCGRSRLTRYAVSRSMDTASFQSWDSSLRRPAPRPETARFGARRQRGSPRSISCRCPASGTGGRPRGRRDSSSTRNP